MAPIPMTFSNFCKGKGKGKGNPVIPKDRSGRCWIANLRSLGRQHASDTLAHLAAAAGTVRQARGYLPSRRVYVTALWSVFVAPIPMEAWRGWVDLGGSLRTDIGLPATKTVTHPDTNRARRRATRQHQPPRHPRNFVKLHVHEDYCQSDYAACLV